MDTLLNGCRLRIFSQVLLGTLLALLLSTQSSYAEVEDVERFCSKRDDGMYSHPWDCRRFVKCYAGLTYIQQCSPQLFFNPKIGVCDRPEKVDCELPEIKVTEIPISTEEEMTSYFSDEDDENTMETLHDGPTTSRAPLHDVVEQTGTPLQDVTGQTVRWETDKDNKFTATTEVPDADLKLSYTDDLEPQVSNLLDSTDPIEDQDQNQDDSDEALEAVQRIKYAMAETMKYAQTQEKLDDGVLFSNQILDDGYFYKSQKDPYIPKTVQYVPYSERIAQETYRQTPTRYQGQPQPQVQGQGEKKVEELNSDKKHETTTSSTTSGSTGSTTGSTTKVNDAASKASSGSTQTTPSTKKTTRVTPTHTVHTVHAPTTPNNYTLLKLYRFRRDLSENESDKSRTTDYVPSNYTNKDSRPVSFQRIYADLFKNRSKDKEERLDTPPSATDNALRFSSVDDYKEYKSKDDIMLQNDSIAVRHPHYKFDDYHHTPPHLPHVKPLDGRELHIGPPPPVHLDSRSGPYYGPHGSSDIFAYLHEAMDEAKHHIQRRLHNEARMVHQMSYTTDSVPFRYVAAFLATKPYAKYLSHSGLYMTDFVKLMSDKYELPAREIVSKFKMKSNRHILKPLPKVIYGDHPMPIPPDIDYCPYPRIKCSTKVPYRTFDGSCNNLKYPILGRSMAPHRRLLPANYANGVDSFRVSASDGSPLPGAREVSFNLFRDRNRPNRLNTLLLMIWGQFVDHDLTRTALVEMIKENKRYFGETEELKCGFDGCVTGLPGIEECKPIPIPHDDYDFRFNRCIKFVRSAPVPPLNCKPGNREQLNQVTTWLDGSMIYGSTKHESDELRDFFEPYRGRMAVTPHPYSSHLKPLLPQDDVDTCRDTNFTVRCFKAGDERVNEQVALTSMHTIWVREHNRIESILHKLNPHWDGERLFQETRRIVIAEVQHIVFNEHLPLVLGPRFMKEFGLDLQDYGYYKGYDPTIDPRIANEFSAAAFRFGHTLIQDRFRRTSYKFRPDDSLMLSAAFRRPPPIYEVRHGPGIDLLVRGLVDFPAQSYDRFFTKQISVSLFSERPPFGPGMDLLSLNIQRARDHGLQSYNHYREFCGMKRAYDFDDLYKEIPSRRSISLLRKIYKTPDDIDLFTGGVYEDSVEGGVVGPTFACIIANQFRAARRGDRFFYENDHKFGFNPDQLQAIRKGTRLARVLCTNSDEIDLIQPWALLHPFKEVFPDLSGDAYDHRDTGVPFGSFSKKHGQNFNRRRSCRSLPDIDFSKWQEYF